jgi:hypothetical protein
MNSPDISPALIQSAITTEDWKLRAVLRAVFRRSFYAFVKFVTCYNEPRNLMDSDTFKESCDWLQWVVTTKKRGLLEDPRGLIKSTRAARGIPEWCAIQVPCEQYDLPEETDRALRFLDEHRHMRGPDSRYVLGCDSKERAAGFVASSKTDWETNRFLRFITPELLWENYTRLPFGKWRDTGYTLNGRKNPSLADPFLAAVGIDSKAQGGRAEGIIIDDLVGETSYHSPAELERRCDWVRTIGFLLENRDPEHADGGFMLVDGNRWALDDVNSMIHDQLGDWAIWHRSAFRCVIHGTGNCGRRASDQDNPCTDSDTPLWLGRYPDAESLARVEADVGVEAFAAQFRNDPTHASELDASQFRPFRLEPMTASVAGSSPFRTWCVVVPRLNDLGQPQPGGDEIIPLRALTDHVISIDPADSKNPKNARTAATWTAMDRPTSRVFILDYAADQWSADEAIEAEYKLVCLAIERAALAPRILVEKVACQGYVASALRLRAEKDDVRIPRCEMVPPANGQAKPDRIRRRVGNRLNQGLYHLRFGLHLPKEEARHFPTGTLDLLDCLAQAEEVYLAVSGAVKSRTLAAARRRKREARLASCDSTGVPI